jgi:hypothetical protein
LAHMASLDPPTVRVCTALVLDAAPQVGFIPLLLAHCGWRAFWARHIDGAWKVLGMCSVDLLIANGESDGSDAGLRLCSEMNRVRFPFRPRVLLLSDQPHNGTILGHAGVDFEVVSDRRRFYRRPKQAAFLLSTIHNIVGKEIVTSAPAKFPVSVFDVHGCFEL